MPKKVTIILAGTYASSTEFGEVCTVQSELKDGDPLVITPRGEYQIIRSDAYVWGEVKNPKVKILYPRIPVAELRKSLLRQACAAHHPQIKKYKTKYKVLCPGLITEMQAAADRAGQGPWMESFLRSLKRARLIKQK